jgi:hypothetical protein
MRRCGWLRPGCTARLRVRERVSVKVVGLSRAKVAGRGLDGCDRGAPFLERERWVRQVLRKVASGRWFNDLAVICLIDGPHGGVFVTVLISCIPKESLPAHHGQQLTTDSHFLNLADVGDLG